MDCSICGLDALRMKSRDGFVHEIHVLSRHMLVPVVVDDEPFAENRKIRETFFHQLLLITELLADISGQCFP